MLFIDGALLWVRTGCTAPKIVLKKIYVADNVDNVADHHKYINLWETLIFIVHIVTSPGPYVT